MHTQQVDEFWRIKVDSDVWKQVLHLGQRKEFRHGDIIIDAGELVNRLYYLESGVVSMKRASRGGAEKIIMHIEENTLFGEVPFFMHQPILSFFICHQDAVVYSFSREAVDGMLARHPEIAKDIIRTLAEKVSALSNQSATLGLDSLYQRIVKFILLRYNSMPLEDNEIISLGSLRMRDIASILGVHRATLYKALKELEHMNLIRMLDRNRIHVLNVDELAAIAYE
jgi:CRP-like cAMP-binding protein